MKLVKLGLRFWITVTSIFSFLVGWIMLAHAPKASPTNLSSSMVAPLATLEPLRPLSEFQSGNNDSQDQPFFSLQPRNQSRPFFTTGGS